MASTTVPMSDDVALEEIAALMQRNMERRLEQQAHELELLFARREEARLAELAASSVAVGSGQTPEQTDGTGTSDSPPAGIDGGSNAGTTNP